MTKPLNTETHTRLATELQATIDLVTAMFWELQAGENLSYEQIATCWHDRVLGVLWYRIWDYAEYCSRQHRLHRVAHTDAISQFITTHKATWNAEIDACLAAHAPVCAPVAHTTRAIALKGHPRAQAMRRRFAAAQQKASS